jgi:hypothetical protein
MARLTEQELRSFEDMAHRGKQREDTVCLDAEDLFDLLDTIRKGVREEGGDDG